MPTTTTPDHEPSPSSAFSFLRPRSARFHGGPTVPAPASATSPSSSPHPIRWRKGELIGAGAFGRVYMGMNLDSGELLAVKQVLIATSTVAKEKAQAHVKELEEEVKLLQNLSHPNIVRYLGTAREDDALNIFLEFVPGGSIASLLGKFGAFPEPVVCMYTRQLLQGLEYLHKNGIMHRDIKGANILVDNKGRIKLADFGASKQVVELVTLSGAKSMKGTPYWMAPEVIRQTGHSLPADIWSVGCTVIEMATGKPPWSQQFQEVAALFHIGTTKSHPPIPEHLSHEAQDFLLKCLKKEPHLRPTATELLQHAFVCRGFVEGAGLNCLSTTVATSTREQPCHETRTLDSCKRQHLLSKPAEESFVKHSLAFCKSLLQNGIGLEPKVDKSETVMEVDENCSVRLDSIQFDDFLMKGFNRPAMSGCEEHPWEQSSFNPVAEPTSYNPVFDDESFLHVGDDDHKPRKVPYGIPSCHHQHGTKNEVDFSFRHTTVDTADDNDDDDYDDDDEVTESKIKAFLDEKALELKRLQTPLYMEYHSIWNAAQQDVHLSAQNAPAAIANESATAPPTPGTGRQQLEPTKSRCQSKDSSLSAGGPSVVITSHESDGSISSGSPRIGNPSINGNFHPDSPGLHEWKGLLQETQQPLLNESIALNSAERQQQWKEELQKELEMRREEKRKLMRLAGGSPKPSPNSKSCSPKEKTTSQRPVVRRFSCASPVSRLQVQL